MIDDVTDVIIISAVCFVLVYSMSMDYGDAELNCM